MRQQLIKLLNNHNSIEKGIQIPLSICEYVDKIIYFSTIIPYYQRGEIIAFISYYNNDVLNENSFLTMILVSKDYQGRGIGKLLLELSIKDLKKSGFKTYSLEVLKSNKKAIVLYLSYGFIQKEDRGNLWLMQMDLQLAIFYSL